MIKKEKKYQQVLSKLESIFSGELKLSIQAKMSLITSILYMEFNHWTFCGFYMLNKNKVLEIGPFQGTVIPCTHILPGQGVCGTCVEKLETIIVKDVRVFDNYISCDSSTLSEIVIPFMSNSEIMAVLDIDSPILDEFNYLDKKYLISILEMM